MVFCGNCGLEVPEGMKFCPNCGTAVFEPKSLSTSMEKEPIRSSEKPHIKEGKRSTPWMIVSIVSLILIIVAFIVPSDALSLVIFILMLPAAIVSLCMKARFRAIPIMAIVLSGVLIIYLLIKGIASLAGTFDSEESQEPKEVSYGQVNVMIPAKYLAYVDKKSTQDIYNTKDENAAILIEPMSQSFSDGQFNNYSGVINNAIKERLATVMNITGSSASQYRKIDGLNSLIFQYSGEHDGKEIICKVIFINDSSAQRSLFVMNFYNKKMEDKYGTDFDEIMDGINVGKPSASSNNKASSSGTNISSGGVDPQLKAALDEYEAFVDEYVSFMKRYQSDPNNALGMLSDYTSMLTRLTEFSEKINQYDTTKMSKEDYAYYFDALNRIEKKMLDIAY